MRCASDLKQKRCFKIDGLYMVGASLKKRHFLLLYSYFSSHFSLYFPFFLLFLRLLFLLFILLLFKEVLIFTVEPKIFNKTIIKMCLFLSSHVSGKYIFEVRRH